MYCALERGSWTRESKSRTRITLGNRILISIGLGIPFIFISCPTRAKQTTPEDRGWKQKATAVQKEQTFEEQWVSCNREIDTQQRERLQNKQFQTHLELRGRKLLREVPRTEVRFARRQSDPWTCFQVVRGSRREHSLRDTSRQWP